MGDGVNEVHAYTTVVVRPEVAKYNDVVASVVNLKFAHGAIGNVESYVQAVYSYDVRTEIVGSKGPILVGTLLQTPMTFLSAHGRNRVLVDHFLTRFADAYLLEVRDFMRTVLSDTAPKVTGIGGLKALEIAVAAEKSHVEGKPCAVLSAAAAKHQDRIHLEVEMAQSHVGETYKSPLYEMTRTTPTCFWNDSVLGVLKKEMGLWKDRIQKLIEGPFTFSCVSQSHALE